MGLAEDLQDTKAELYQNLLEEFDRVRETQPGTFFDSYWHAIDEYEQQLIEIYDRELTDRIEAYADDVQHRKECLSEVGRHDSTLNDYLSDDYTFSDDGIKLREHGTTGKFLDMEDLVTNFGDAVANASDPEDFYQRMKESGSFN
ncbi:MAG: hypothetical protein SVU32_04410, partial [Candidatus Nanohaloarchaea archaeon]|nr:hypothetical protein [Candidatus Nanohaloarchaea archaeon]